MAGRRDTVLWRAVTDTGHADPTQYDTRLSPVLDRMWQQWGHTAQAWRGLSPAQVHLPDPALTAAGRELRAATRELIHDPAGPATPQTVAGRVDLDGVTLVLSQALATTVDLAHVFRDATGHPDLLVSARGVHLALNSREEAVLGPDFVEAVVDAHALHTNRPIPLPHALRARVQVAGDTLVLTSAQALGASAGITSHHHTPHVRTDPAPPPGPGRGGAGVESTITGPARHSRSTGLGR